MRDTSGPQAGFSAVWTPDSFCDVDMNPELSALFHRLNNQLGIILAHAELLEVKSVDEVSRARATQVVASVLDAMETAKDIRRRTEAEQSGV